MAEIINLNKARKQRRKAEKSQKADENRRTFGRSKQERVASDHARERGDKKLDGKEIEKPNTTE